MSGLVVDGVSVTLNGRSVVRQVSFSLSPGAWVALVGPNGAGKTTLLRAIAGLTGFSGDIRLDGTLVSELSRRKLSQLVALVPQRPFIPSAMTVTDYLLLGRTPYIPYLRCESDRDLEVAARVLDELELRPLAQRSLGSLSGGELQRAVLARALAQQAPVLLLDEPTSALDVGHQQHVLELVDDLRANRTLTVVSAMHDLTLAAQFSDTLLLLSEGSTVAVGPPRSVLTEDVVRRHFGATVRVLDDEDGGVAVVPARKPRRFPHLEAGPATASTRPPRRAVRGALGPAGDEP